MPASAGRSEAEWSCPNTGDGCNGILSLNDVHRGQRVITSSQLVYQPERDGEKKSQEAAGTGDFIASVLLFFHSFSVIACMCNLRLNKPSLIVFTSHPKTGEKTDHLIPPLLSSHEA